MPRPLASRILALAVAPSAALLALSLAGAQQPSPAPVRIVEDKPGLARRATVPGDSARKLALARVRGGRITAAELEEEDGRLIYSFDIAVAGRRGIAEVHVDARSGAIVKTEHEVDDARPAGAGAAAKKP
jgi:hypothetical protein